MLVSDQADKERLVEIIRSRGMFLWHACQFKDFRSYLRLGGIPSRSLLESQNEPFTRFETDEQDRKNFVWDKVFCNLEDFGCWFAEGKGAVPNPYGPVQMRICPEAIYHAEDVSVTLRSAGGRGFDRENESLRIEEILELYPANASKRIDRDATKRLLEKRHSYEPFEVAAPNPEMSCSMQGSLMPIRYVDGFVVDPICIDMEKLVDLVGVLMPSLSLEELPTVVARRCTYERKHLYQELVNILSSNGLWRFSDRPCDTLPASASKAMSKWIKQIRDNNLEWQLRRYCTYMLSGTVDFVRNNRGGHLTPLRPAATLTRLGNAARGPTSSTEHDRTPIDHKSSLKSHGEPLEHIEDEEYDYYSGQDDDADQHYDRLGYVEDDPYDGLWLDQDGNTINEEGEPYDDW